MAEMHLCVSRKFGLGALCVALTGLSAGASVTVVNQVDGVNFSYTAVDTNGVLAVTFDPASAATKIDGSLISPTLPATFAQLTLSPSILTNDIPGLSGHFTPNLNTTKYGISSLTPPGTPNVVFDYSISFGQVSANGLTMTGAVALDPASSTTFTQGATTYDFSPFQSFASFTLSLGTQAADPTLIYDVLLSGNGTFSGTGQFDQFVTATPEPASIVLIGIGVLTVVARRRSSK
jgi:PEP-CTERM motif-containing protein